MAQPTLFSVSRRGITPSRVFNVVTRTSTRPFTLQSQQQYQLQQRQDRHRRQQQQQQQQQQQPQQFLSPTLKGNQKRSYHSTYHPTPPHEYSNSQTTILSAALAHVPAHGFSHNALTLGAREAGFLDVSVQLLPRGEFDLVLFWLASRRGMLRDVAAERFSERMTVEEKTNMLILERLWMNEGVRKEWQSVCFFFRFFFFFFFFLIIAGYVGWAFYGCVGVC